MFFGRCGDQQRAWYLKHAAPVVLCHVLYACHASWTFLDWDSTAQHSSAQHSTAQLSTAQHSSAQHSIAQHRTAQNRKAQHYNEVVTAYREQSKIECCHVIDTTGISTSDTTCHIISYQNERITTTQCRGCKVRIGALYIHTYIPILPALPSQFTRQGYTEVHKHTSVTYINQSAPI